MSWSVSRKTSITPKSGGAGYVFPVTDFTHLGHYSLSPVASKIDTTTHEITAIRVTSGSEVGGLYNEQIWRDGGVDMHLERV